MNRSLDPELARFLKGELHSEASRQLIRNLLLTWQRNRQDLEPMAFGEGEPLGAGAQQSPETQSRDYDWAFASPHPRLEEHAQRLAREREQVPGLLEQLMVLPLVEQRALLRTDSRFRGWVFCERLVEECRKLVYIDPARAEELANLALTAAEQLEPRVYGRDLINDLKARAWASVGEVLRSLSDLRSADDAFATAERLIGEGTGDALEEACILELKASLRRDQRRIPEAHRLLDEAIAIYRQYRDFHLVGRGFAQKGRVHGAANDLEGAIRWLRKGLGLIDPTRERRLELSARHSLMLYLQESGQHREAWFLLKASRPEFLEHGGPLLGLRLRWLEGKIQQSMGFPEEAEHALVEARHGFIGQGIGFGAAMVSLDLATLYASQNRATEMRQLAEEMLPVFHSRDLHREAIAALIVFQQAVRMEKVTVELLGEIRSYLRQARKDHKLRFEYSSTF
ncbi:MAG TPA: hypothetical protein VMW27_24240 [Thermoanaerobaculia bacterium]|nr:hypothetical protein [Thermoanaerobaculia bacterium]